VTGSPVLIRCKRVLDPLVIAPVSFQIKYFHFLLSSILSQLAGERKKTPLRKSVSIPFTRHTWTNPVYPSLLITSAPPSFPPVEFPAVLLNTSTGEIQSEFHTYVQPQEHPVLSEFCTELTGITQVAAAFMPADAPMVLLLKSLPFHLTSWFVFVCCCFFRPLRAKWRPGSRFTSVCLGSAAGCRSCSSRWVWFFPTGRRDLLRLRLPRNRVLSSHGQVRVNSFRRRSSRIRI
uniref:Exonuclease domain-containing protein n=1 Tax=Gasterosteus aculeatus aculeatus TaxID=481459 RepID=A0AAQ4RDX9_GASAC